jgi:hypothetical protein
MKVGYQWYFIPCTEHIVEVVKLAYIDASIVSQKRLGPFSVRGGRVANLHADGIGLKRRVTKTLILHEMWRDMTFSAAAAADSSSIHDIIDSDFLKDFTISM